MITRYDVRLDGRSISDVDPSVIVTDIVYNQPMEQMEQTSLAGRDGSSMRRRTRSASVSVSVEIHEQDPRARMEVCRRLQSFAMRGGVLTTSDRPGQRLRVVCTQPPVISSALRWTQLETIIFTAYDVPYWEDIRQTSLSVASSGSGGSLYISGTARVTPVSVSVTNTSSSVVNTLTVTVGDTSMSFASLGLASGAKLVIDYDDAQRLRIRIGNTSKMDKRTAESSDDLLAVCNQATSVTVAANASVTAVCTARGRWY